MIKLVKTLFLRERQRTTRPIRLAGELPLTQPQGVGEAKAYKTRAVERGGRGGHDESAGRRTDEWEWADRCTGTLTTTMLQS